MIYIYIYIYIYMDTDICIYTGNSNGEWLRERVLWFTHNRFHFTGVAFQVCTADTTIYTKFLKVDVV